MRTLISATCLALALTACGGDDTEAKDRAADEASRSAEANSSAAASASAAAEEKEEEEERAREAERAERRAAEMQAEFDACTESMGPLLDSLQEIDSRLNIGLNYDEYSDFVGDAQVAYDRAVKDLDAENEGCFAVGIGLEEALNQYINAFNTWQECFDDYDCDFNEGPEGERAQGNWAKATRFIDKADRNLEKLAP